MKNDIPELKVPLVMIIDCGHICGTIKHSMKGVDLSYKNINTNIIYVFLNQLSSFIKKFKTRRFVFCWDSHTSKRLEVYPEYKANRKDVSKLTEEDIIYNKICYEQYNKLREDILPSIGFKNNFYQEGYEADDLIASLVNSLNGCKIGVVANDHDLFQFLSEKTFIYKYRDQSKYTSKDLFDDYNITPNQWAEVLSISGCTTDNVKGVVFDYVNGKPKHVGKNTAIKYVKGRLAKTKSYSAIISETGRKTIERNKYLTRLPLEGTITPIMSFNEVFFLKNFENVCERYGLYSFLKADKLIEWRNLLEMK